MKKFFTLFVSALFSLSLLAFDGSRLSIAAIASNMQLVVEVDGRKFNMKNNSLTLNNLAGGSHHLRIYREMKRNGNVFAPGRKQQVIYASNIVLKRGFHTDITVNRFGKVFVDERRMSNMDDDWYEEDDVYYDDGGWNNGYGNVMSAPEFDQVKEQIRKEWFESSRLISVKTIIDKNNFTALQVKEMMLLFTFESNKLEVARYAYRKTVDKQNYYLVNDALTFSSSRDELARFIRDFR